MSYLFFYLFSTYIYVCFVTLGDRQLYSGHGYFSSHACGIGETDRAIDTNGPKSGELSCNYIICIPFRVCRCASGTPYC